jgi:hypothetical protein
MKLTLHIEWLRDEEPYETIKKNSLDIQLPNSDFYYAFEAWMNLSNLYERYDNECLDRTNY